MLWTNGTYQVIKVIGKKVHFEIAVCNKKNNWTGLIYDFILFYLLAQSNFCSCKRKIFDHFNCFNDLNRSKVKGLSKSFTFYCNASKVLVSGFGLGLKALIQALTIPDAGFKSTIILSPFNLNPSVVLKSADAIKSKRHTPWEDPFNIITFIFIFIFVSIYILYPYMIFLTRLQLTAWKCSQQRCINWSSCLHFKTSKPLEELESLRWMYVGGWHGQETAA